MRFFSIHPNPPLKRRELHSLEIFLFTINSPLSQRGVRGDFFNPPQPSFKKEGAF
jgi:hypothetical protein